jgi:quercetin dioxygenase-like cupin family protein
MAHADAPKLTTDAGARRLAILGDELLVRLTGLDTNGRIALFEERSPPGGGVPMHVHEREDETFQVLAGTVEFTIRDGSGDRVLVARTGDSVWAPRGVAHAWRVLGDEPVRLLFAATPAGIEGMFEELATLPKGPPDFTKIAEVCGRFGVRFA